MHKKKLQEIHKKLTKLEEIALAKIHENSFEDADKKNLENLTKQQLQNFILKQQRELDNLNHEIFSCKKLIKNLEQENEFLRHKNKDYSEEVFQMKIGSSKLISIIEEDFENLQNIVKQRLKK